MAKRLSRLVLGCAMALLTASLAQAQPRIGPPGGGGGGGGGGQPQQQPAAAGLIEGTTPELTARMLQQAEYTDVKVFEHQGTKHVAGKVAGNDVFVLHHFCQEGSCKAISFVLPFGKQPSISQEYIDAWNDKTFARLRRSKGDLFFDMDVFLFGGVTAPYIATAGAVYALRLKELLEFKGN